MAARGRTRAATGRCDSISPRAPTSPVTAPKKPRPSRPPSTVGRERHWRGGHPPRCWPSTSPPLAESRHETTPRHYRFTASLRSWRRGWPAAARGYRRSGPPSGPASTTTAAVTQKVSSSLPSFRVTGHTALRRPVELRWSPCCSTRTRCGERSSRAIECRCRQDVAYRVIAANLGPDHATIARFISPRGALAELFASVLAVCANAGLVRPGVMAIDGTRVAGDASQEEIARYEQIAREISRRPGRPTRPRTRVGERAVMSCPRSSPRPRAGGLSRRPSASSEPRERPEPTGEPETEATDEAPLELDAKEIVGHGRQGRDAWLREVQAPARAAPLARPGPDPAVAPGAPAHPSASAIKDPTSSVRERRL